MAKKILNTNGEAVKKTAAQLENYDVIRYSASSPDSLVELVVKDGGKLNLASELKNTDAEVSVKGGALKLTTGGGDDSLSGGGKKDVLNGGDGNDSLAGGGGDDKLSGGAGDDAFVVSGSKSGVDTFKGGKGADSLLLSNDASLSRLTLDEEASVEQIDTNFNELTGTSKNDVWNISGVIGYTAGKFIDLREGDDKFTGSQTGDSVSGGAGADTLSGGLGSDTLIGGVGDDLLNGDGGDDYLVIFGTQSGVDTFRGGEGTDYLSLSDDVQLSKLTLDAAASVEQIDTNFNDLTGTSGGDVWDISGVLGYSAGKFIDLREGADKFTGTQTGDSVFGGAGDDSLSGGLGDDTLSGGVGDDLLNGESGNDIFVVFGTENGVDTFRGGEGTDYLSVSDDTQLSRLTLDAAASVEQIDTNFNDFTGTSGSDVWNISGVLGYTAGKFIDLREGNDSFLGSQTGDNVSGSDGDDTINGGLGNDSLYGGLGNDSLTGGSGNDRFYFDTGPTASNIDTITDFTVGTDIIALENDIFTEVGFSVEAIEFTIGAAATTADQNIIYDSGSGKLFYDSDGVGGAAQIQFAQLEKGLLLNHNSFDAY